MRALLFGLVAAAVSLTSPAVRAEDKPAPRAGWFGVYPAFQGYQLTFGAPTVGEGKKPATYQQTVKYEWTGGRYEIVEVTLARDPAFKQKYAAETLKKQDKPPKEVTVGKRSAWLWDLRREADGKLDQVAMRLVVPLAEDCVLLFEVRGMTNEEALIGQAKQFDLKLLAEALTAPPRTDFRKNVAAFRALKKEALYAAIVDWVGHPDKANPGNATYFISYDLTDGGKITLSFDYDKDAKTPKTLRSVRYEAKDGKTEELLK